MKLSLILTTLVLSLTPAFADKADDLYKQGMAAAKQGDAVKARALLNEALRLRPDHPYARFQLGRLKGADSTMAAKQRAAKLAAVTVSVNFQEAELGDALEALGMMVEKKTSDEHGEDKAFTPNFMIQDRSGELAKSPITLQLKGVPANKVMDFMLQQAGGNVRYDEHAIIIRPNQPVKQATPTTEE
ncbi:tetratricopeptide repeat protein [Haloferula rosea]|uniref:Tetratricopeptide repeat protein n=1 Tax=Haloferula rosea TaxID=490093 RepID=A0A934VCA0_9BACT|nr:tetratricopeptide repeat protein [Haloferula rosea]MBK1828228.1 tetratricopeptide repeat protein [Haloferula rosea]